MHLYQYLPVLSLPVPNGWPQILGPLPLPKRWHFWVEEHNGIIRLFSELVPCPPEQDNQDDFATAQAIFISLYDDDDSPHDDDESEHDDAEELVSDISL